MNYYRFESDVIIAVNGRSVDGTRTNNGSAGGSFRGTGGLRVAERRLRLILGMEINDGKLIRPSDDPAQASILYDWDRASGEAISRREEIRRQRWEIKQRELELLANRNFLKPQRIVWIEQCDERNEALVRFDAVAGEAAW